MSNILVENVKAVAGGFDRETQQPFVELTLDGVYESDRLCLHGSITDLVALNNKIAKAITNAAKGLTEYEDEKPVTVPITKQQTDVVSGSFAREALGRLPFLTVYVPKEGTAPSRMIAPSSGIVGVEEPAGTDQIKVYFEGNLHNAVNLKTFADRCMCAAGRLLQSYPTVAFGYFRKEDLIPVGRYYIRERCIGVFDTKALSDYMMWNGIPAAELTVSG